MLMTLFGRATIIGKLRYYFLERNYSLTIRVGLISLCLLLTMLSAVLFKDTQLIGTDFISGLMPTLVMAGLTAAIIAYSSMEKGLLTILVVSTVLSDGLNTGTGTKVTFTFILLYLMLGVWLFRMLVVERRIRAVPAPANKFGIAFIIVVIISFFWSGLFVDPRVSYLFQDRLLPRLMTAMVMIISVGTYFLFASQIRSLGAMRFFVWWFIVLGAIFLLLHLSGMGIPSPLNARGQFPTWVGALALGQALFNSSLKWWHRGVLLAIVLGWFYVVLGLGISWLSGWLPLLVVTAILLLLRSRRLFAVLMIVVALAGAANFEELQEAFTAENEESGGTRVEAWAEALDLTGQHFLFGTGPAGYAFYYATYGFRANFSHNNYVDLITQTGIVGFITFIIFWILITAQSWRLHQISRINFEKGDFYRTLAASLLAANCSTLVTMMLGDWVTPFTYTQGLGGIDYTIWSWMIAGLTTASYHEVLRETKDVSTATETTPHDISIPAGFYRIKSAS